MPGAVVREPLVFGKSDHALFGWHHAPPAASPCGPLGLVICPSLGHEYVNAHRSLRHLADSCARAGVPSLRFDYPGTGDSAGTEDAHDLVEAWIDSVQQAADALRARSGVHGVALLGFRVGALVAAQACTQCEAAALVLWAPCLRGRQFLREMRALDLTGRTGAAALDPAADAFEAGGFRVTRRVQQQIDRLDLTSMLPRARCILIAARDDTREGAALESRWTAEGLHVERQNVPGYASMVAAPHNTVVPHAAVDAIARWLAADRAAMAPVRVEGDRDARLADLGQPPRMTSLRTGSVREVPLWLGRTRELFGMLTEPAGAANPAMPAIILTNAGAAHHTGPNRLHVGLGRALAQAGFRCVRLDMPGLGDSVVDDEAQENVPYQPDASATVAEAIEAVRRRTGALTAVVMGLCSGAHTAFHAACDLDHSGVVEAVVINPLTFAYTPGMSLDAPDPRLAAWRRYGRSVASRRWASLFSPQKWREAVVRWRKRHRGAAQPAPPDLASQLRSIVARGRRLTFVFSDSDPGYDLLMGDAARTVRALRKTGDVRIAIIDGANHTFDASGPRAELIARVTTMLVGRYRPSA